MRTPPLLLAQLPDRVAHLWVDPKYGDDMAAAANNPLVPPVDVADPTFGVLLNKPWPFKTVTEAVNSIPVLPYVGTYARWTHAIIHALPGMYARTRVTTPNALLYPDNGLEPNGETFPILLPKVVVEAGVSQGWHRYTGPLVRFVTQERFGASAPFKDLYPAMGFTVDRVVAEAVKVIG